MKAFIFPGQGCQKKGMGKELYDNFSEAKTLFEKANELLSRRITDVMFYGDELELSETINTQPAVFLYEVITAITQKEIVPDVVAGHSLGEFAALVVSECLSFNDGLRLVQHRATIGQKVCEKFDTAMGAIIGLSDDYVKKRLQEMSNEFNEPIYFANYNGPGQVVITGSKNGIRLACKSFKLEGAKKAVQLPIGGSFHSPFMKEAGELLCEIILNAPFSKPKYPIYQCVDGKLHTNPLDIKQNLILHITHPVLWTNIINNMVNDGVTDFIEVGTDDTLQKIVSRMFPKKNYGTILNIESYRGILKDYSIINK